MTSRRRTTIAAAQAQCLQLGVDIEIRDTPGAGRGLFAKALIPKGSRIALYGGNVVPTPTPFGTRTHMIRVPDTNVFIDGLPIAHDLMRNADTGAWSPSSTFPRACVDWLRRLAAPPHIPGFASIANSAPTSGEANARMEWVEATVQQHQQHQQHSATADAADTFSAFGVNARFVGYLVATRDIHPGEEIRHCYQYYE